MKVYCLNKKEQKMIQLWNKWQTKQRLCSIS